MTKALISILLVCLFLFANLQMSLGTHFCGGRAVESAFILADHSLGCGMEDEDEDCESHSAFDGYNFGQKECCNNDFLSLQLTDDFNKRNKSFSSETIALEISVIGYVNLHINTAFLSPYVPESPPPLLEEDIQVLFQTFLI